MSYGDCSAISVSMVKICSIKFNIEDTTANLYFLKLTDPYFPVDWPIYSRSIGVSPSLSSTSTSTSPLPKRPSYILVQLNLQRKAKISVWRSHKKDAVKGPSEGFIGVIMWRIV